MSDLAHNLAVVRERIARACDVAGRSPAQVVLIAVTKTVEVERIREAFDLGLTDFGENRVQEALSKMPLLDPSIRWHCIGKLQSNKARRAAEHFCAIHTIENEGQLREVEKAGRTIDLLIEVNVSREPQKSGVFAEDLDEMVQTLAKCTVARFQGLMTVGPAVQNAELMRPYFRRMRELGARVGATWLSMGMSQDFDVAIQEGATHVRVGSALFGARTTR